VLLLRGERRPIALVGDWAGGGALLGSSPLRVARADEDPFAILADQPVVGPGDAVVGGGWFGVLGYGLGELIEHVPPGPPAPVPTAAHRLAFHDHIVRFDGERWWFEALWSEERDAALRERLEHWRARMKTSPAPEPFSVSTLRAAAPGEDGHRAAVSECVRRIADGELLQANLTLRLEGRFAGDPIDLFAHALPRSRPRFGALFDGIVSLSPERFLRRNGRRVETDPIKGTAVAPGVLRASAKDAAEHVMIVDLMRNDLGRVCAYGSIATQPPRLEPHANVWHLVSTISGELRPGATDEDLLRATFPPGSVTGAPKVQAVRVITELEATRRETYTGAMGYASPVAGLELSVAIRTFEIAGKRMWLGVGGGIIADSDPEAELAEALTKAAGPIAAISADSAPAQRQPPTRWSGRRMERALEHGMRPDPRLGLLETILVVDGQACDLDAHLARLAASGRELYDAELPSDLAEQVARQTRGTGRLRVTFGSDGATSIRRAPLGVGPQDRHLHPFLLPGGLGRHKWADRRLAGALTEMAHGATPLLVDTDGAVLEASWANVFLAEGDALITPPADGRLLPGIRRGRLDAAEVPFDVVRLAAADDVVLTSALRLVGGYSPSSRRYSRAYLPRASMTRIT